MNKYTLLFIFKIILLVSCFKNNDGILKDRIKNTKNKNRSDTTGSIEIEGDNFKTEGSKINKLIDGIPIKNVFQKKKGNLFFSFKLVFSNSTLDKFYIKYKIDGKSSSEYTNKPLCIICENSNKVKDIAIKRGSKIITFIDLADEKKEIILNFKLKLNKLPSRKVTTITLIIENKALGKESAFDIHLS